MAYLHGRTPQFGVGPDNDSFGGFVLPYEGDESKRCRKLETLSMDDDETAEDMPRMSVKLSRTEDNGMTEQAEFNLPVNQMDIVVDRVISHVASRFPAESVVTIQANNNNQEIRESMSQSEAPSSWMAMDDSPRQRESRTSQRTRGREYVEYATERSTPRRERSTSRHPVSSRDKSREVLRSQSKTTKTRREGRSNSRRAALAPNESDSDSSVYKSSGRRRGREDVPRIEIDSDGNEYVMKYVEVPVITEVVREVQVPEVREVIKTVTRVQKQYSDKFVDVPQIKIVEKRVEVPQIEEVIKHVIKHEIRDRPRLVVTERPKIEIRHVEKIVHVKGRVIEIAKPFEVIEEIEVPVFRDHKVPILGKKSIEPQFDGSHSRVVVSPMNIYEPEIVAVDVCVPVPVDVLLDGPNQLPEEFYKLVELTVAQKNSLVLALNKHLLAEQISVLIKNYSEALTPISGHSTDDAVVSHPDTEQRLSTALPFTLEKNEIPMYTDSLNGPLRGEIRLDLPRLAKPRQGKRG